jgi:hypothetical protein
VDITGLKVARADARATASTLSGSCGGSTSVERVFLWRTTSAVPTLRLEAQGATAMYVRRAGCGAAAEELECSAGDGTSALVQQLSNVEPGAYFIVVEGEGLPTLSLAP